MVYVPASWTRALRRYALNSCCRMRGWFDPQWWSSFRSVYRIDANPASQGIWIPTDSQRLGKLIAADGTSYIIYFLFLRRWSKFSFYSVCIKQFQRYFRSGSNKLLYPAIHNTTFTLYQLQKLLIVDGCGRIRHANHMASLSWLDDPSSVCTSGSISPTIICISFAIIPRWHAISMYLVFFVVTTKPIFSAWFDNTSPFFLYFL